MYVITKCAVEAQAAGSSCFAIQFFGECWIGPMACVRYNMYKESKKCYNGVGLHWGNFVYRGRCGSRNDQEVFFLLILIILLICIDYLIFKITITKERKKT